MPILTDISPSAPNPAESTEVPSPEWPVEFIGLPGSGKTSLANRLIQRLRARSLPAVDFDQALALGLARAVRQAGGWKSAVKAALCRRPLRPFWHRVFCPHEQAAAGCEFAAAHPDLLASLGRVLTASEQHPEERNRLFRYLSREFAGFQLFANHRRNREILVWDEGFCHRALSLWGRWPGTTPEEEITAYVAAIPRPAHVFHVSTGPQRCIERMQVRGFSPFVEHPDSAEVLRKMERLQTVVELTATALARRGVPVVRISTEGTLDESDAALQEAAATLARETAAAPASV